MLINKDTPLLINYLQPQYLSSVGGFRTAHSFLD